MGVPAKKYLTTEEMPIKLLILDLDETLIHATRNKLGIPEDFIFDEYYIYKRPQLEKFITHIAFHCKIGIWSSAGDTYVNEVVKQIKPATVEFEFIWGRSKCSPKRDPTFDTITFEKRLNKLKKKGFRLEDIIIVDDSPQKARTNYGNAVYIKAFMGDPADEELQHLQEYLMSIKDAENVRNIEKRGWRFNNSSI